MVLFSSIKKIREKTTHKDHGLPWGSDAAQVSLSNTPFSELSRTEDRTPEGRNSARDSSEVAALFVKLLRSAKAIQEGARSDQPIHPDPILADLHTIIERNLIQALFEHAMSQSGDWKEMSIHSVEVTLAALMVGKGMAYDTKKLLDLGLAAFLENVGMYWIPEEILQKSTKLETKEINRIREHPQISGKILARLGDRYEWLSRIALQVHERLDGSGYPKGIKGSEISESALIIGLVDTYIAMIRKRAYRERIVQPDAIGFILKEAKSQFPIKILKAFLNTISLFPFNTYVRLNNKSVGRVISTDKNHPLRPTVEVLLDSLGNKSEPKEIIRLSENPLLYIVETLDERDLK